MSFLERVGWISGNQKAVAVKTFSHRADPSADTLGSIE